MLFTFRLYKGRREVRPTNNVNGHNVLLLQLLPVPSTTEADVFRADSMHLWEIAKTLRKRRRSNACTAAGICMRTSLWSIRRAIPKLQCCTVGSTWWRNGSRKQGPG